MKKSCKGCVLGRSRVPTRCYLSTWTYFSRFVWRISFGVEECDGFFVSGGAKGPGLFFILPCVDNIVKVDLRTTTFNVPPQEVIVCFSIMQF